MSAFNDISCRKCRKRYGFMGKLTDAPTCPKCGTEPDRVALAADQKIMDEFQQTLLEKSNAKNTNELPTDEFKVPRASNKTLGPEDFKF